MTANPSPTARLAKSGCAALLYHPATGTSRRRPRRHAARAGSAPATSRASRMTAAFVIVDRLKDMYISGRRECLSRRSRGGAAYHRGRRGRCRHRRARRALGRGRRRLHPAKSRRRLSSSHLAEGAIRRSCASRLARYKQPAHIRFVEAIPRTGSGKARKNLLRDSFLKSALSA